MTKTIKTNTGGHPKLSIVIPTRNRKMHVELLLLNLYELLNGHEHVIQIIVSDNSDKPMSFQNIAANVQVIRPATFLPTAEENLFFGLQECKGEFVWPLGDDDIPQKEGIDALLDFLKKPVGDWAVFNYGVIDFTGVLKSQKLLNSSKSKVNFRYSDFVSIAGYQTTAACISLTIFRRTLVTSKRVDEVSQFISPIYSHVALYLLSFGKRPGLFIDTPLVNYRNNRQATRPKDDNWVKWSKINQTPYRHPWTVGLIEQLDYLVDYGSVDNDFPLVFLETDHFGNKFSGLDQMIFYIIDQIRLDKKLRTKYAFSQNERITIGNFLMKYAPQHTYLIEALQKPTSRRFTFSKTKFANYNYLIMAYGAVRSRFVFSQAVVRLTESGTFFRVPMGYMYLPHGDFNYLEMLKRVDFFQSKALNFDKNLNSLSSKVRLIKDPSKLKPKEAYSFSNFDPHVPNRTSRIRQLAHKVKIKLS